MQINSCLAVIDQTIIYWQGAGGQQFLIDQNLKKLKIQKISTTPSKHPKVQECCQDVQWSMTFYSNLIQFKFLTNAIQSAGVSKT